MIKSLLMLFAFAGVSFAGEPEFHAKLDSLSRNHLYFSLDRELTRSGSGLDELSVLYFRSIADCAFNKPEESNSSIRKLFELHRTTLTDSMAAKLFECMITNSVRLFDYVTAQRATDSAVAIGRKVYDKESVNEIENSGIIWKAAGDVLPQTVTSAGLTKLKTTKDIAGLTNIPVKVNGNSESLIFDTGANFSTMSESIAKKFGLTFLEGSVKVGTATDKKVDSRIAYAGKLEIGNMTFTNVLFLVLPDEALSFGGGIYVIKAIIGLPVIMQMGEIHLTKGELSVPEKSGITPVRNLALHDFTPVVEGIVNTDTLMLSFDTGAKGTTLYYRYFELHKSDIERKYEPEEITFAGAGGEMKVSGYRINGIEFRIGGSEAVLNDISVFTESVKTNDEWTFGNLGNDLFGSFKTMIIDFTNMSLRFEGK